jgi:uncharacterized surface protein with fasciclin (FAS1) repeats
MFAPTNAAFSQLPPSTLDYLLDPANIKDLSLVLMYHVVEGKAFYTRNLTQFMKLHTVEGDDLDIFLRPGPGGAGKAKAVYVDGYAKVMTADNGCVNGVAHTIDRVLFPHKLRTAVDAKARLAAKMVSGIKGEWKALELEAKEVEKAVRAEKEGLRPFPSMLELAESCPDLSEFVAAAKAAHLERVLAGTRPYSLALTLFAPTNGAFRLLPRDFLHHLLEPAHIDELIKTLTYHMVYGSLHAGDLRGLDTVRSVEGGTLDITQTSYNGTRKMFVNEAEVVGPDNECANGVLHLVDHVLIPSYQNGAMKAK